MLMLENVETLDREELIDLVRKPAERVTVLEQENAELKRSKARSAAPFSKDKPKHNPKKPSRKPGQGEFKHREAHGSAGCAAFSSILADSLTT